MPDYFEHKADIGIIGKGNTIETAFVDAASAMFGIMTNLNCIKPHIKIKIEFTENDVELALVTWLNLLLANASSDNIILSRFELIKNGNKWRGVAYGEHWRDDIERGTEVKGATLTELSVRKNKNMWIALCVVDV